MKTIILAISIVVGCAVIGGALIWVQHDKQTSIERQQQVQADEQKRVDDAKADQDKKEYVAKQKSNCLDIYKTENAKWTNVTGWRYDAYNDKCKVEYKADKKKSDSECDKDYPTDTNSSLTWFWENALCKDGKFENSF